ncbi:diaminopimelate decarboxylase [Peptococcus simiae]|uniref:Diaminopimelate decarboxylase n=1 Tax=Peptococcus simiae TaxID=1643805 RepID=A0ABW9GZK8_9FIRM
MKGFPDFQNKEGRLVVGECTAKDLAATYGTPLYVYDEEALRRQARTFVNHFKSDSYKARILYASKAASFAALIRLAKEEGLNLDVVSEGELYTALAVNFPPDRIIFHGNNKLDRELEAAVEAGIGFVVLDNLSEARRLSTIADKAGQTVEVLLRVNPGVEAHTHDYIKTATSDSKFGLGLATAGEALQVIQGLPGLRLRGLHCHIGSQIFADDAFIKAAHIMLDFMVACQGQGLSMDILDLGGGFGVFYEDGDQPIDLAPFLEGLAQDLEKEARDRGIRLAEVWLEPGRSMVNNAGLTLYTVGDIKRLADGTNYAFIDGGMGDNMRVALYQAGYTAVLADRLDDAADNTWRIAGKYCESGDVLIKGAPLPDPQPGDILAILGTGAYTFSMFSGYNRLPRPAVVFVKGKDHREVVRRESLDDIIAQDLLE